jgi:hypothetical protein
MDTVYLVRNDNNSQIKVVLTRQDTGQVIDLQDATVLLKVKRKGASSTVLTIQALVGSDFENGEAIFNFESEDLTIPAGEYTGEIETSFISGNIETTYDEITLVIRDDY